MGEGAAGPPGVAVEAASPVPLPSSTDSTVSSRTLKGVLLHTPSAAAAGIPLTPSYPFPRMDVNIKSPLKTPDLQNQFVPFTALSPTTEPPSIKLAKAKLAQDFKASGHLRLAMSGGLVGMPGYLPPAPPDNLRIAIQLQREQGLKAWWSSVCQIAKESFGAERASLAVPSDLTDIENVPWVQLATFRGGNEDAFSRLTNERTSDRSNLTEVSLPSRQRRAGKPGDALASKTSQASSNIATSPQSKTPAAMLAARPKLELRHSYAGYPPKDKVSSQDFVPQAAKSVAKRPRAMRASSSTAAIDQADLILELNEETLEKHDQAYEHTLEMEQHRQRANNTQAALLEVVQPLESEADALIDGSGIFKVVHRGVPVLLTRQYRDIATVPKDDMDPARSGNRSQTHTPNRTKPRPGPAARSKNFASKTALRTLDESPEKASYRPPYEDFEQVPQSPWSQSPAPSPAARETDDNPFFPSSNGVDESAFDERQALHRSEHVSPGQIPAIGLDRSSTIVQIPLIHPDTRPTQHITRHSTRSTLNSTFSPAQDDSIPSGTHQRYAPVAILSLLIPVVPYPIHLSHALTELSPLLAATFVSARKHSSLVRQLESLSRRRRFASGLPSELSFQTETEFQKTAEFSPSDSVPDGIGRPFSPASLGSQSQSQSDQSRPPSTASEGFADRLRQLPTPGLIQISSQDGSGRKTPKTPSITMEASGSYFVQDTSQANTDIKPSDAKLTHSRNASGTDHAASNARLHSQGANFAATHPALPTATSSRISNLSQVNESKSTILDTEINQSMPGLGSPASIKPSVSMLQTMIDNGAAQQWISAGSDGMILWANAKFLVYRQSKGEDLDTEFWDSILPKERSSFRSAWANALQTGEQFSRSCRLRRFNSQYRWFSIRVIPIKDRHGVTKYFHGQAMDIHDQREAERSVHRAKEHRKYRTLANSIPVIVFAAHVPTGISYANSQWLSYSGQSEDEYKGFGFLDHVHPDDLVKCRFPGFSGNPFPSSDESRQPLYRHDSSTSNASSNAESEGTAATEDTARPARGEPDEDLQSYVPGDLLRQLAAEGIVACEKDGLGNLSITTEMRLKSKTGEYRWHVVSGSYIDSVDFGSGDAPAQWFLTATDITSQKQTESRIADAKMALENANSKLAQEVKSKMSYLSSMAHEIRTPLNGIIGNLQFLINTGLAEDAYEWAHGAKDAATNMSELINDILDLSKAEAKMLHLSSHVFSPREITENVLDQLNSKCTERHLEMSVEVDPRVPFHVKGDSGRMRQVLLNLVGNAVKFTPKGEIWVSCDLMTTPQFDLPRLEENERYIQWKISDTGKGFTEADRDYLFKEYSQIKKRKDRDIGGTGLGLVLCKTMVELHGGKIDATSEQGKGACFYFFARFKIPKKHSKQRAPSTKYINGVPSRSHNSSPSKDAEPPSPVKSIISPSINPVSSGLTVATPASISSVDSISLLPPPTKPVVASAVRLPPTVGSPTGSSAGSSIMSGISTQFAGSMRSSSSASSSTNEGKSGQMTLTLPDKDDRTVLPSLDSPVLARNLHIKAMSEGLTPSLEGVTFRPPMYSVLLYCPASNARRITGEQIQYVVPKSVPCQLKAEADVFNALDLLSGDNAVTFSHVVVRTTSDEEALRFIDKLIGSDQHQHTCLVLITNQAQMRAIIEQRPEINIKSFQKEEKLLVLQKPCHTWKLSKVFDPLKENDSVVEDPQAAKRREEKRLQKEAYALFKREFGERKLRVLAVEDNPVQMNVLSNFLVKICGVELRAAYNGLEALEIIKEHPVGYFSAIVSDIEMPIMGGYEMIRELRKWEAAMARPPAPTVSLSANTVKEGWVASAAAGFTHFTPKPVNFTDLGNVLLEVTQPGQPHRFLRDRPLPKELSGANYASSDEESEEE